MPGLPDCQTCLSRTLGRGGWGRSAYEGGSSLHLRAGAPVPSHNHRCGRDLGRVDRTRNHYWRRSRTASCNPVRRLRLPTVGRADERRGVTIAQRVRSLARLQKLDVLRRGKRLVLKGPTSRDCVQCRPAPLIWGSPRRRLCPGSCPAATLFATACRPPSIGHRAVPIFGGRVLEFQRVATGLVTRELRKSG